jgi:hypothetical protein
MVAPMKKSFPATHRYDSWERQERLQRLIIDGPPIQVAGFWREDPGPKRQRLRVIGQGRHSRTGVAFVLVQSGGSGAGWYPAELVELALDEPYPA